jgi:DNA mismatch repair protein MSH6
MVPAHSLELTPMDGCFVRMGARDAILSGQSTFYIEMAETAAMLSRASSRSLVALDELGRGTATLDGEGAAAVCCVCDGSAGFWLRYNAYLQQS